MNSRNEGNSGRGLGADNRNDDPWRRGNSNNELLNREPRREEGNSRDQPWSRSNHSTSTNDPWQKVNSSSTTNDTYISNFSQQSLPLTPQRPEHLKLKLDPRTAPVTKFINSNPTTIQNNNRSINLDDDSNDKWSKVFSKFGGKGEPSQPARLQVQQGSATTVSNEFSQLSVNENEPSSSKVNRYKQENLIAASSTSDSNSFTHVDVSKTLSKKALREEAEKKAKSERIAALEIQRLENESIALKKAKMVDIAKSVVSTNKKGTELQSYIENSPEKPTASAIITVTIANNVPAVGNINYSWLNDSEYGLAIKYLLKEDSTEQVAILFSVQEYCHSIKFPKVMIKEKQRNLIEVIFQILYRNEIVDEKSFLSWVEDDSDSAGRTNAIVQTTSFISVFNEKDEEFNDDEDVDADREVVK